MKSYLLALASSFLLSGCWGIFVGSIGTFETSKEPINLDSDILSFTKPPRAYSRSEVISLRGSPDSISSYRSCEVFTYYNGWNWSGVGALVVVIPIPLLLPSGQEEERIYIRDGHTVGKVRELSDISYAFGYGCGSRDCMFMNGATDHGLTKKAVIPWCD